MKQRGPQPALKQQAVNVYSFKSVTSQTGRRAFSLIRWQQLLHLSQVIDCFTAWQTSNASVQRESIAFIPKTSFPCVAGDFIFCSPGWGPLMWCFSGESKGLSWDNGLIPLGAACNSDSPLSCIVLHFHPRRLFWEWSFGSDSKKTHNTGVEEGIYAYTLPFSSRSVLSNLSARGSLSLEWKGHLHLNLSHVVRFIQSFKNECPDFSPCVP